MREVMALTGYSRPSIYRLIRTAGFPRPLKMAPGGKVLFRLVRKPSQSQLRGVGRPLCDGWTPPPAQPGLGRRAFGGQGFMTGGGSAAALYFESWAGSGWQRVAGDYHPLPKGDKILIRKLPPGGSQGVSASATGWQACHVRALLFTTPAATNRLTRQKPHFRSCQTFVIPVYATLGFRFASVRHPPAVVRHERVSRF